MARSSCPGIPSLRTTRTSSDTFKARAIAFPIGTPPEPVPEQSHLHLFDRHKRQGEGQEIDPLPIDFEMIKKYGGTGTYVQILIRKLKRFLRAPQGQRA